MSPAVARAAACEPSPSTDSQVTQQQNCVSSYIAVCEKDYDKQFCNDLSVDEVNQCARDSAAPAFKDACMKGLETAYIQSGPASTTSARTSTSDCQAPTAKQLNKDNCEIINMVVLITNIMAGFAALVIVGTLIWGGILYSMAGADPNKVQAAKAKLMSGITALLLLIFGYSLLQWLTPGGLF